jgi:hypothetical protein
MKPLKEQIKKLCDKFDKSTEDWEDFFPREILSLFEAEKKEWIKEIEKYLFEEYYQRGVITEDQCLALQEDFKRNF